MIGNNEISSIRFHRWWSKKYYVQELITIANTTLFVCVSMYALIFINKIPSLWYWHDANTHERNIARKLAFPILLIGIIIIFLENSGPTILEASYHSSEYLNLGGAERSTAIALISFAFFMLSIIAGLRAYGFTNKKTYMIIGIVIVMVVYFHLMRGQRRITGGLVFVLTSIYLLNANDRYKYLRAIIIVAPFLLIFQAWPYIRFFAVNEGLLGSFTTYMKSLSRDEVSYITDITRFPNLYWNLLTSIDLYNSGISRGGETFYNLIPQLIPKIVAEYINYTRPLSEPWVLAKYVDHGGAFFTIAQAYWNYGLLAVIAFVVITGKILIFCENYFRNNVPLTSFGYFLLILTVPYTFLTGVQELSRSLQLGLGFGVLSQFLYKSAYHGK